ncbi:MULTISPECIES: DUF5133 domain-containing protein [unclassified Streptomyces]|uniref:DUF5133 domain-containing protein n=1 Tax=unclassified Streptomyces TaxID=2593676 RepID=UPI00131A9997|nr:MULTISPECIES: DUF5133 domain-containing protein [unclassified Streptomyces]
MTPAPAREAERILSSAAARAGLPETTLAQGMLDDSRGLPAPARAERALRQAVQAARTPGLPPVAAASRLLPLEADVERALTRFFDARLRLAAAPGDATARRAFEDSLFTLSVLMAEPCAYTAVREAVQYAEG